MTGVDLESVRNELRDGSLSETGAAILETCATGSFTVGEIAEEIGTSRDYVCRWTSFYEEWDILELAAGEKSPGQQPEYRLREEYLQDQEGDVS